MATQKELERKGVLDKDGYYTTKKKKGGGKDRHRDRANPQQGFDVGAVFKQGLDANWGARKVPQPKEDPIAWLKKNRTETGQPGINTPLDPEKSRAAVAGRKAEQEQFAPKAGDPEAFRVAFGKDGMPVGFNDPKGKLGQIKTQFGEAPSELNRSGDFTDRERGDIRGKINSAPREMIREQELMQRPVQGPEQAPTSAPPPVDLAAVFAPPGGEMGRPQAPMPQGVVPPPPAPVPAPPADTIKGNPRQPGGMDLSAVFSAPQAPAPQAPPEVIVQPQPTQTPVPAFQNPTQQSPYTEQPYQWGYNIPNDLARLMGKLGVKPGNRI